MKKWLPNSLSTFISPLMLAGVFLVLTPIFAVMTLDRMNKLKFHIIEQQLAKGISLIRTFEASTRTGMMTMHWGLRRIQDLLEETSLQPDVSHIMIVSQNGEIIAHSDPIQVGQVLVAVPDILDSGTGPRPVLHRYREVDGEKVFEVYKVFTPMDRRVPGRHMRMHGMNRMRMMEMAGQLPETGMVPGFMREPDTLIVVGFPMVLAERAQARLLRHAAGQGVVFFILGCAGVISLMAFQAYRTTRNRLTSTKALSEKLRREVETTRHLAAIGKLAAGVAHEIRNPLSSIKGFATYFEKRYADHPDDVETAQIMVQEVERINRSITQLLEFARPMAVDRKPVEIRAMITHSLKLVAWALANKSIAAKVDIQSARSRFYTDPDRMNQILLNLYMNSLAAMDVCGTLTVAVVDVPPDNGLEIRVTDDGCGMEEALLPEIFDPYFTTRPDGTGLGLSIVHRLVENLGGEIRVESVKDMGTTFFIRFPEPEKEETA